MLAEWTFGQVMWSMLIFFCWILWFWFLFTVFGDVFRRHDISGWTKTLWCLFVVFLPFLGVFVYLIANSDDMAKRNMEQVAAAQAQTDEYVRSVAGSSGPAAEIEKAKALLESGAISQQEYDAIKAKALAS